MGMEWDDLRTVMVLVRQGTLAAAAAQLGVSYTTVARRIARAETRMGTRLFDRLPDGYRATKAALVVAERAGRMQQEAETLDRELTQFDDDLTGPLVITSPQLLIGSHLGEVIETFLTRHPGIDLTVKATNDLLNLNRREADLAIRIQRDPHDTLIGQRLTGQKTAAFAAPALAQRIAQDPAQPLDWIGFTFWDGPPRDSLVAYPKGRIRMRFDDMVAVVGAAQAGLGVARMPMFLGRYAGLTMVPVMEPQPYADIWALSHRDIAPTARVRAFREVLIPFFRTRAGDFVG
ncbi:LysR family transcriptional regulator [Thalassovita taeanensis]|uniref:Transcriptional regulator, LysR family n=1 Tax=Thalassovita taeanensis TaxID=657014 RepID=A0A1H9IM56_9RHOB|nr:LysR family transcriptional regulator [Thalassovita taeanensis]SEQ75572.1 transcriptional regulator, LysR family [Thalassovita taeanensis]